MGKQERTYPIYHSTTDMKEDVVEIRVPEGYVVDYVPEPVRLDFPFAYYEHAYTVDGHLIRFRSLYRLMETRISVEQYPQYKQFVEQRAQELDKQIVLREMGS